MIVRCHLTFSLVGPHATPLRPNWQSSRTMQQGQFNVITVATTNGGCSADIN